MVKLGTIIADSDWATVWELRGGGYLVVWFDGERLHFEFCAQREDALKRFEKVKEPELAPALE